MNEKVILGLSGGVDSAVAARLLMERGYDVTCVYLQTGGGGAEDARETAAALGLPFLESDVTLELEREVCRPFAEEYLAGRTPSPCALCNPRVKFPALLRAADRLGAPWVATGHYARTVPGPEGGTLLQKGLPENDQSYMLARLTRGQLKRIVFPLGGMKKSETRALAAGYGLPVADKPDSMEICFIPGGDHAAWLDARGGTPPPGDFVDADGHILGRHKGIHHYTLGQGSGLGVSGPHKYYVSAIRPETDQVVLGDGSDLFTSEVTCTDPNWLSLDVLAAPREVTARFRHSKTETAAVISPQGGGVLVRTAAPVRAPTPGQLAVFYEGDTVVGSAWIT